MMIKKVQPAADYWTDWPKNPGDEIVFFMATSRFKSFSKENIILNE